MNEYPRFFGDSLQSHYPVIASEIALALRHQQTQIELVASENIVSPAVLEAQGAVLANRYAEGIRCCAASMSIASRHLRSIA
ncbi:serine hydroxymethyltransferase [Caballeronia novacaledonica]|uniref:Serine hydroxymethyltransferase n=1 Tax=Caballeronia novacaledonica TaxID=1544861 RepID=A0A2U3I0U5_9BURK|nr:serine hydroxymethyltransferase [Caballeronia novacaledonica]